MVKSFEKLGTSGTESRLMSIRQTLFCSLMTALTAAALVPYKFPVALEKQEFIRYHIIFGRVSHLVVHSDCIY